MKAVTPQVTGAYLRAESQQMALAAAASLPVTTESVPLSAPAPAESNPPANDV